jgi:hypothetical protein
MSLLSWFGLGAAPFAWATQHVAGYALGEARCGPAGAGLHFNAWAIVVTAVFGTIAAAGIVAAIVAWRGTSADVEDPPEGRIHFVSVMGMAFSPLFLVIILMSGLGAVFLPDCVQS